MAAPSESPDPSLVRVVAAQWPIVVVLAGICVSLVFVALDRFRVGSVLMAGFVALAFVLRAVLPTDRAGLLAVRGRGTDLVVLGVLATGMVVLSLWVPPPQ